MATIRRKEAIIEFLRSNRHFATVEQLGGALFVSGATVRRDLSELERSHLIRRTRGGAILIEGGGIEDPLDFRENQNVAQKQIIAQAACHHILDDMTLFLDSSSTAYTLARFLDRFSGLRVVTNGLKTAWMLSDYNNISVMCTGGTLREHSKSLVGQPALDYAARLNADIAFMSCRGFSLENGASEASEDEYNLKQVYLKNSRKSVLMCDSTKMGVDYLCRIAPLSRFDDVITERKDLNDLIRRSV